MDTKLPQIAAALLQAAHYYDERKFPGGAALDIDSTDRLVIEGDKCSFVMTKDVESSGGGHGPSRTRGRPLGRIVYTVAITAEWQPHDDE